MLIRAQPQQPGPQRHLHRQVKRLTADPRHHTGQLIRTDRDRLKTPLQPGRIQHQLAGLAAISGKDRAQHLVPDRHISQRRRQRGGIQLPGQPQRVWDRYTAPTGPPAGR